MSTSRVQQQILLSSNFQAFCASRAEIQPGTAAYFLLMLDAGIPADNMTLNYKLFWQKGQVRNALCAIGIFRASVLRTLLYFKGTFSLSDVFPIRHWSTGSQHTCFKLRQTIRYELCPTDTVL